MRAKDYIDAIENIKWVYENRISLEGYVPTF